MYARSGFRFRTYDQQCSKWLFTMRCSDTANKGKMWTPDVVCSIHFHEHDIEKVHSIIYYLIYYATYMHIGRGNADNDVCVYSVAY